MDSNGEEPTRYSDHRIEIRNPEARCTPWPEQLECRRGLHQAFIEWYRSSRTRFALPLELLEQTDDYLWIGFYRISRILTAALTTYEMNIVVEWRGTCWDFLHSFDAIPKRVPGGYVCDLCPEDDQPLFSSPEALWREEIFEPFLEWVNGELAGAVAVSVSGCQDRTTWARLVVANSTGEQR